ncbi:MAG: transposase [Gammaproteobacteria bacterium]
MPRKPRFVLPGEPQHIIIRGVNRKPVFYNNQDYRYYLGRLKEAIEKHNCHLHTYVLMTNHIHLLMSPTTGKGIGKAIQMLGRYYTNTVNWGAIMRSGRWPIVGCSKPIYQRRN